MRLLADESIPRLVVEFISSRGHDASWIGEAAPGVSDQEVLSLATAEKRTLIKPLPSKLQAQTPDTLPH